MGGDVPLRPAACVAQAKTGEALRRPQHRCQAGTQPVATGQLAGADPKQRDQIAGLPEAVAVGLREADTSIAQQARVEAPRFDRDRRSELGLLGPEGEPATTGELLDKLDPALAQAPQQAEDRAARERVGAAQCSASKPRSGKARLITRSASVIWRARNAGSDSFGAVPPKITVWKASSSSQ